MAKSYGQIVTLVRGGVELNALVLQSTQQPDGEHLVCVYLDPEFNSPLLGGSAAQRAVATAFTSPLQEGGVNGWKEVGEVEPIRPCDTEAIGRNSQSQKIAADTAGTDGTSPSDSAPVDASVAAKEEPGDEREAPPAPPQQ